MRNFTKYVLRNKGKIVYVGITNNLERRCREHCQDKNFTSIQKVGNQTTFDAAKQWEAKRLNTYRRNHGGENPKYNDKLNG